MSDLISMMAAVAGQQGEEVDDNFNQTVLLLHGDGTNGAQNNTFLDSGTANGGSGFTVTRNGNTTQGTFSPFSAPDGRWSVSLGGTNDNLSVNVSGIAAGTSTFTLGLWLYLRAFPAVDAPIIDTRSSNGATTTAFQLGILSTGELKFYDGTVTNLDGFVSLNTWTHIQLVRDSGDTVTLYVNGTATGTTVQCTRNLSDQYFWIGCNPGPVTPRLNAYISNLKWVVGSAIAPTSGGPTSPESTSTSNQQLLACYGNRFIDSNTATTAKAITITGAPKVTPFSPFAPSAAYSPSVNGGSGYFDGTGDWLSANDAGLALGSGTFTIDGWFYCTGYNGGAAIYSGLNTYPAGTGLLFYIDVNGTYQVDVNGSNIISTGTAPLNAWTHFSLVRSSTSTDGVALYINNVSINTGTTANNFSSSYAVIGRTGFGAASNYFLGYLSGIRIVIGSANAPSSIPTAPPTNITNTSLLLNFTNAGIFDQTGKNNLETVADAQIDTTTKKYGTGSMEFDGTGDWLKVPNSPDLQLGTGDFTIEFWVYLASGDTGSARGLVAKGGASTGWLVSLDSSEKVVFTYTTSTITSSGAITTNAWNHIAVVREGTGSNETKIYIGGTNDGTGTVSTDFNQTEVMYIGANRAAGDPMKGFIDDLRITKGVARYTSNFTAPTKAFPDL